MAQASSLSISGFDRKEGSGLKKFICRVIVFILLAAVLLIPVNVVVDPFNVFHARRIRDNGVEPNANYIKTKYVIENPEKFDSYLFGSSRVGFLDVEKMTGGTYYNMTYSEGLPYEHYLTLKAMIAGGEIPKNVLVGVDDISCFVDPKFHNDQLYRLSYPYDGTLVDKAGFYLRYCDTITTIRSLPVIKAHGEPDESVTESYYRTGTGRGNTDTRTFDEDQDIPYWEDYYAPRIDEALQEIAELRALCEENGIRLVVFTNPLHATTYRKDLEYGYLEFLEKLAEVTPYYNFSGFNDVTCDNGYYHETSHYSTAAGDLMVRAMFEGEVSEPLKEQGFGVYVTEENVKEVMALLREQASERGIVVCGQEIYGKEDS